MPCGRKRVLVVRCSRCGARSPRGSFERRMAWLRRHYRRSHPRLFWAGVRRAARRRRRR
jgi:hypothetical protein